MPNVEIIYMQYLPYLLSGTADLSSSNWLEDDFDDTEGEVHWTSLACSLEVLVWLLVSRYYGVYSVPHVHVQGQFTTTQTHADHFSLIFFMSTDPHYWLTVEAWCPLCAIPSNCFETRFAFFSGRITNCYAMLHPAVVWYPIWPPNWHFQNYLQPVTIFTF